MGKFICPKNGNTYQIEEKNGKRFFFSESGVALQGFELNVVRNWYEQEHPTKFKKDVRDRSDLKQGRNLLKENDYIFANDRADFLIKLLGWRNKSPFRSSQEYNGRLVWMVCFDMKTRDGWKNKFLSENECCQYNVESKETWDGKDVRETFKQERVTFQIIECNTTMQFVFRGIFECEKEKSDPLGCAYFEKVADEFEFYKQ